MIITIATMIISVFFKQSNLRCKSIGDDIDDDGDSCLSDITSPCRIDLCFTQQKSLVY